MNRQPKTRPWARRIIMPLLILFVAGGLVLWDRQRQEQRDAEVEQAIAAMMQEIAGERPPAAPPLTVRLSMSRTAVEIVEGALAEGHALNVNIVRGDLPPPFGDGSATHRALVDADGGPLLTLRILHTGRTDEVRMIGYVRPEVSVAH